MKTFTLQNVNTAAKMENYIQPIIYLNGIKVFDRMNNICLYNFEHS